jgi:tripartite-type tricarboxylate transporter receptor subunit TctC
MAMLALAPAPVRAQVQPTPVPVWPVRPVRLLVGGAPGSSPDEIARALAPALAAQWGQPVDVDNQPGAGGALAASLLARTRDDHTLGLIGTQAFTVARLLMPGLEYDPLHDLQPVSMVATTPLLLCLSARLGVRGRLALQALQAAGADWRYGSAGHGSIFQLGMEMVKATFGWQTVHVPYPGNPQVINALLEGDVQVALLPPALVLPQWRAGRLPVLGQTTQRRSPLLPRLPTLAELAHRPFHFEQWYALAAPSGVAAPAVWGQVARDVARALANPALQQRLQAMGWWAESSAPQALHARRAADYERLRAVIEQGAVRAL